MNRLDKMKCEGLLKPYERNHWENEKISHRPGEKICLKPQSRRKDLPDALIKDLQPECASYNYIIRK